MNSGKSYGQGVKAHWSRKMKSKLYSLRLLCCCCSSWMLGTARTSPPSASVLDGSLNCGDLRRCGQHIDRQREALASSAAACEAQVVEVGTALPHGCCGIAELGTAVVIISCHQDNHHTIRHIVSYGNHREGLGQGLVAPPVLRKAAAQEVWAVRLQQASRWCCTSWVE